MSQSSSEESANLLSPPSPALSAARAVERVSTAAEWRSCQKRDKKHNEPDSRERDELEFDEKKKFDWRDYKRGYAKSNREKRTEEVDVPKRPSDEFLEENLPLCRNKKSTQNVLDISENIKDATFLNRTVEVDHEEPEFGGMMTQLTCDLGGMTQNYTGPRDEESDDDEAEADGKTEEARGENLDVEENVDADESISRDEFEIRADQKLSDNIEKDSSTEIRADQKLSGEETDDGEELELENPPFKLAAKSKRRKRGPTEKALLEEEYDDISDSIGDDTHDGVDFGHDEEAPPQEDMFKSPEKPTQPNSNEHEEEQPAKQTAQQTILTNYTAIENMSRALTCPICCHSLKSSVFLPCGHAFCRPCLTSSLSHRSGGGASCPVCRLPCGRRSGMPLAQLDEIVVAFKGVMRSFGFAPVVHSKRVMMTQLSPGGEVSDEEEDMGRESSGIFRKRRKLEVDEALEHHQIAQSNRDAFASFQLQQSTAPSAKSSGGRMTKEELEILNRTRRYQILARDQEAVVQADEEVVEKIARKKKMVAEETAAFTFNGDVKKTPAEGVEGGHDTAFAESSMNDNIKLPTAESHDTFHTAKKIVNKADYDRKMPAVMDPIESQDTSFHTAKSECSSKDAKQPRSSIATASSPTILHDGNTAKKAKSNERIASKRIGEGGSRNQSFSTACSPIVVQDGNTVQKKARSENNDATPRRSGNFWNIQTKDKASQKNPRTAADNSDNPNEDVEFNGGAFVASQQSSIVSEESGRGDLENDGELKSPSKEQNKEIVKGSIVMVEARTWPGINKPGGVGRVSKVETFGNSKKYDIAYVLGGKEKCVDESFVSLHETSESAGQTVAARVSRSAEKASRPVRQRKLPAKKTGQSTTIPVFDENELQHIPADVLAWAGIAQPKKVKGNASKETPKAAAKRVLAESNPNVSKKAKTQKVKKTASKEQSDPTSETMVSFQSVVNSMSTVEIIRAADAKYSNLLLRTSQKHLSEGTNITFHAVTSSLSEEDTKLLSSFVKMMKSRNVNLKIMKDFKPGKTQLCITSTSVAIDGPQESNVVSKSRTLKVMRAALSGLPILTPRWMKSCIEAKKIVAPVGVMCIRSLPTRGTDEEGGLTQFGVSKYAAAIDRTSSKVLSYCSVLLCGTWRSTGSSTLKDLKILLQDSGATVVNSASTAAKMLADRSDANAGHFIFLCDDSHLDADCGIPESLLKSAKTAPNRKVLTVHFHWLFDSVSCAKLMTAAAYEPLSPRAKELWSLCC